MTPLRYLAANHNTELAAQCVLDALKREKITPGQARTLLIEEVGFKCGHAHLRILKQTRLSVLKPVEPAKKAAQPVGVTTEKRKSA